MHENRRARLGSVIIEEVSRMVRMNLKDPRIAPLVLTRVEIATDGSQATLFFTLFGAQDDPNFSKKSKATLEGLTRSAGYLKRELSKFLTVKVIPQLVFKEDRGFENTLRVHELLKQIEKPAQEG